MPRREADSLLSAQDGQKHSPIQCRLSRIDRSRLSDVHGREAEEIGRRRNGGFGHFISNVQANNNSWIASRQFSTLDGYRDHDGSGFTSAGDVAVSPSGHLGSAPVRNLGDGRSSASAHESAPAFPNGLRCESIRRRDCLSASPSKRSHRSVCDR